MSLVQGHQVQRSITQATSFITGPDLDDEIMDFKLNSVMGSDWGGGLS